MKNFLRDFKAIYRTKEGRNFRAAYSLNLLSVGARHVVYSPILVLGGIAAALEVVGHHALRFLRAIVSITGGHRWQSLDERFSYAIHVSYQMTLDDAYEAARGGDNASTN